MVMCLQRALYSTWGGQRPFKNLYLALHAGLVVARYQTRHLQGSRLRESDYQFAALARSQLNGDPCAVGVGIRGSALSHFLGMPCNFLIGSNDQFMRDFAVIEYL